MRSEVGVHRYNVNEHQSRVPAVTDMRWHAWAEPLHTFLCQPRDWDLLRAWGRANQRSEDFVRHMLAWLEIEGRASSVYRDGVLYWVGYGRPEEAVLPEVLRA
jgi:hypothetical protein